MRASSAKPHAHSNLNRPRYMERATCKLQHRLCNIATASCHFCHSDRHSGSFVPLRLSVLTLNRAVAVSKTSPLAGGERVAVLAIYSELQLQSDLTSRTAAGTSACSLRPSSSLFRSLHPFVVGLSLSLFASNLAHSHSAASHVCSQLFPALICTSHVQPSPSGTHHPHASTAASVVTLLQHGTARQQRHSASLQHMPEEAKLQRYQPSTHSCSKQAASQQLLQVESPHCQRSGCPARCRQL
jgi:hypothetical protein